MENGIEAKYHGKLMENDIVNLYQKKTKPIFIAMGCLGVHMYKIIIHFIK